MDPGHHSLLIRTKGTVVFAKRQHGRSTSCDQPRLVPFRDILVPSHHVVNLQHVRLGRETHVPRICSRWWLMNINAARGLGDETHLYSPPSRSPALG